MGIRIESVIVSAVLLGSVALASLLKYPTHRPANKVALWEELKSLSELLGFSITSDLLSTCVCVCVCVYTGFARLVTSVYASSLLASFMSVQLSILGGLMLQGQHKVRVCLSFQLHYH